MIKNKTKIAVVGAGFTGLATAWRLSNALEANITIFDPGEIGENASGISAGLLHPFTGPRAKMPPHAQEAMQDTLELMEIAEKALGIAVMRKTGLLRPATNPLQEKFFQECAAMHSDTHWLSPQETLNKAPGINAKSALYIETAYQIETKLYLEGLWKACSDRGIIWKKIKISSLNELRDYEAVILATGAALLPEVAHLRITPVKGQLLTLEWDHPLPIPVNPGVYIVRSGQHTIVGATYEHQFTSPQPDLELAIASLLPKMLEVYPSLVDAKIIDCNASLRASAPSHQPLIFKANPKTWMITGMGSKGLLYHAHYSKKITEEITSSL